MTREIATDVLVVGLGAAGAAAAIAAHDAGARVLIVEKASEAGGNTLDSGGTLRTIKDPKLAAQHFALVSQGTTPVELFEAFCSAVAPTLDWLRGAVGARVVPVGVFPGYPPMPPGSAFPSLFGAEGLGERLRVAREAPGELGGASLMNALLKAIQSRGIEVSYHSTATRLRRATVGGRVSELTYQGPHGEVLASARRGVVLASGGFASSPQMLRDYISTAGFCASGPPGRNTGDGIRLAIDVGADLWHMNAFAAPFGYMFPELEAGHIHHMKDAGFIYVDADARRYLNETSVDFHACTLAALAFDPVGCRYPRVPSYLIFDERTRAAGPIALGGGWNRRFPWSADNKAEIERGWIKSASTLEQLGELLRIPSEALRTCVEHYNLDCQQGHDSQFERAAPTMRPLAGPPFYGIELHPCLLNTQGGPRRDAQSRVLDTTGVPIPGLFSAGELGSIWGGLYPGAANITEALVSGRFAGVGAAAVS